MAGLTGDGVPTPHATPWLKQWWFDLQRVATLSSEVAAALSDHGWFSLPQCTAFFKFDPHRL
eukprot:7475410-Heterocapsa_arctica.AAC.1